jgi:hypothetical protein
VLPIAVLVSACSSILGETPVATSPDNSLETSSTGGDEDPEPPTTQQGGCIRFTGDHRSPIDTGSVATDALSLSGETFLCADDVVVVEEGDLNEVAAAAQLAAAVSGPLLFPEPRLAAELGRLKPERVHLVGGPQVNVPGGARTVEHDVASTTELALDELGATETVPTPAVADSSTIVEAVLAIEGGDRVATPPSPPAQGSTTTTSAQPPALDVSEIVSGVAAPVGTDSAWLVDAGQPQTLLMAAAFAHILGASVLAIDGSDILGHPEVGEALNGRPGEDTRFVGTTPEGAEWELSLLAGGQQLPGGGFHVLPTEGQRRYLAYYGHPETDGLGVLGEQGPAETLEEMQPFVEEYGADGAQVVPTFEMIASVASAGPTDDGDYSYEWPIETFQPWVDFAGENGMYVVLDLQSGRDDFLSQAVQYEELLKLPHVGLALDPEWRLEDDQVHLEQIGSVGGAEVNEVIDWLGDLVRDNGLPQKMLIVHQFRLSMITGRDDLKQRPEIQLVIQMDGEGGDGESSKDATYRTISEGTEDAHWAWGWKNFFDEDVPGPPAPASVIAKEPPLVYISYQ